MMGLRLTGTFTALSTGWLAIVILLILGHSESEAVEKCDVSMWYITKIGEGLFSKELTEDQKGIKATIEEIIERSSTKPELANVDCSKLKNYESMFSTTGNVEGSETEDVTDENEEDVEVDETEMLDDETETDETDETEGGDETEGRKENGPEETTVEKSQKGTDSVKNVHSKFLRKCRKKKLYKTSVSCVFVNTINFRCSVDEGHGSQNRTDNDNIDNKPRGNEKSVDNANKEGAVNDPDQKVVTADTAEDVESNTVNNNDDNKNAAKDKNESNNIEEQGDQHTQEGSANYKTKESKTGKETDSAPLQSDESDAEGRKGRSTRTVDQGFDMDQFQRLLEKTSGQYMIKIQTLETQIMKLENELLTEKLNKQNHSSSFTRLENQILKLENELLKMNLSYEELKEENERISKKQKSFLELDYEKRPGDRPGLTDSTKHFELINQHQNKISELTDHLKNQSHLIEKMQGKSDDLEDQNRVLFQIVMNQTMLISQMMKKVEALSESNMKHKLHRQFLSDKLEIALGSGDVMENLHALVSDKTAETDAEKVRLKKGRVRRSKRQSSLLSLSKCYHPNRSKASCGFNSLVLSTCLLNESHPMVDDIVSKSVITSRKDENEKKKATKDEDKKKTVTEKEKSKAKESSRKSTKGSRQKSRNSDSEETKLKSDTNEKVEQKDEKISENETSKKESKSNNDVKTNNKNENIVDKKQPEKETEGKEKAGSNAKKTEAKPDGKENSDKKREPEKNVQNKDKKVEDHEKKPKEGKATVGGKKDKKKKAKQPESKKVVRIPPLYNTTRRAEPKDCSEYLRRGKQKDGQYKIMLHGTSQLLPVFCDMKNGGWTVIQRRQDGTVNFFRNWKDYKKGFGGIYGEHWLGNDAIHRMTNQDQYEMRIDMMDWEKTKKVALYEYVRVDNEDEGYRLHVEGYSGDAGDGFSKHNGEKFSTKDVDNDRVEKEFGGSCANRFKGAWWYYKCYASNLNGKFYRNGKIPEKQFDGITWKPWTGPNLSLKKVEIKIRPISTKE